MAKLSMATKAVNEANRIKKSNATKAVKAKAMHAVGNTLTKPAEVEDKIVSITGTAIAQTDDRLPVIALASTINPADTSKYVVTAEQREYVTKMIEGDILPAIAGIRKSTAELTWIVACISVAIAVRLMKKHQEAIPTLNKFLDALAPVDGQGVIRVNAIKAWLEAKAPVTWGKDNLGKTGPLFDKEKHKKEAQALGVNQEKWVATRLAAPFWKFKPEAEYAKFDFAAQLGALIKKAQGFQKLNDDEKKTKFGDDKGNIHLSLVGLDIITKAMAKANKAAETDAEKVKEAA